MERIEAEAEVLALNGEVATVDEDIGVVVFEPYHPSHGVFVPDGAPVREALLAGTPSELTVPGNVLDYLVSAFESSGVEPRRAALLGAAMRGLPPSQMVGVTETILTLSRTFAGARIPDDGQDRMGVSVKSVGEAMRGLLRGNDAPVWYVLPSQLLEYAQSISVVETRQYNECVMLSYVGVSSEGIKVPPKHEWTDANVDEIVNFINRRGGKVVSFPIVFERIARAVYRLIKYSFPQGRLVMGSIVDAAHAVRPQHANILLCRNERGLDFKPEVCHLITMFRKALENYETPRGVRDTHPHYLACILLRESVLRNSVIAAFADYLRLLPELFRSTTGKFVLPPLDWHEAVVESLVRPHQAATFDHPLADMIPSCVYGRSQGALGEVAMVLDKLEVYEETNDVTVITGTALHKQMRANNINARDWLRPGGWPAEVNLRDAGNMTACVVITRGDVGGVNDMPSSVLDVGDRDRDLTRILRDLTVCAPHFVAVCGPFTNFEEVPDWVSTLGRGYALKGLRPCMGTVPMFWAYGTYTGHVMSTKELKDLMRFVHRDLQLSLIVRDAMSWAGRSSFPFTYRVMQHKGESVLHTGDDQVFHRTDATDAYATFLWSKLRPGPAIRRVEARVSLMNSAFYIGSK